MNNPSGAIGELIRTYRKSRGLTLEGFAEKIHKSKATMSKYEKGEISMDVNTLFDIADALEMPPERLLENCRRGDAGRTSQSADSGFLFSSRTLYVYFYDGRVNKLRKNVLKINRGQNGGRDSATLFFNVKDFDSPHSCKSLYYGEASCRDLFMYFYFDNQSNAAERVWMCAVNPLEREEYVYGMIAGISNNQLLPASVKCVLSDRVITDEQKLMKLTALSKKELKDIRQLNMFTVSALSGEV